jgi:RNA polymerase sigma-70 factor (ECF subfamily)
MLSNSKPVPQSPSSDEILEEAAFEALYQQHHRRVHGVLFRLLGDKAEAEDVAQQVFLKLHHSWQHRLLDESKVAGWLYRVAVNEGYNALRSRKRRNAWYEKFDRLWPFSRSAPDPAHMVEGQEAQAQVRQILAEMKPCDAKLLLLRHSGLSYQELAAVLEVPPGSIGPMLTQARRTFAGKYRSNFPGEEV